MNKTQQLRHSSASQDGSARSSQYERLSPLQDENFQQLLKPRSFAQSSFQQHTPLMALHRTPWSPKAAVLLKASHAAVACIIAGDEAPLILVFAPSN
jgi:hypothetical protein